MKEGEGRETSTVHDKKRQHGTNVQKMEGEGGETSTVHDKKRQHGTKQDLYLHTLLILIVINFFGQQDRKKDIEKESCVRRCRVRCDERCDSVTNSDNSIGRQVIGTFTKQRQRSDFGKIRTLEFETTIGGIVNGNLT
jgi:hypothetical protein